MKKLGYTKTGIGIGALAGIGIFGCALSAGIIATPLLVPAGLGIIAGSALAGGIIGYLAYPSNSPQPKNNNSSRRIRSDSDPHPDPHYTKNLWKNCFSCFER
jgi:hypothetical protein